MKNFCCLGSITMPIVRRRIPRSAILGRRSKAMYYRKMRYLKKRGADQRLATIGKVKKLIHASSETKFAGMLFNGLKNQGITVGATDTLQLLPQIANGVDDNQRIGNRINPRGLLINLAIEFRRDADPEEYPNGTTIYPRIMVLSQKSVSDWAPLSAGGADVGKLLDHGQGEHGFDGTLQDYMSPINKDAFVVHKDIKTMLCSNSVETGAVVMVSYKIWVKTPKQLTYNDGQVYPKNFAPFMCIGFARSDNQLLAGSVLGVHYTSTLYYEDE